MASTDFPAASSDSLILTHPNEVEKYRSRVLHHTEWGGALGLEDYLARESYLTTIPLARDGGITGWILTESSSQPDNRPVLSSCETWRKRVLVTEPGSENLTEATAYGVGTVFTDPKYRGHGYGSRMLRDLGERMKQGFEEKDGKVLKPIASALWSDIGKRFYAKIGWPPFASTHFSFPVDATNGSDTSTSQEAQNITYENLEMFSELNEKLLRESMSHLGKHGKKSFAFIPDYDTMRWHLFRDDFITSRLFKTEIPETVKGAFAGPEGNRIWATWARNYQGDGADAKKNTLYILHMAIEDDKAPLEDLTATFAAVLGRASTAARRWNLGHIELWNPTSLMKTLADKSNHHYISEEREQDSIPSLMWLGEGDTSEVDWVMNEKFCWC